MKGGVPIKLDEDLKPRLVAAAGGRKTLNDFCVGVLADRFGVKHEPSGRAPRAVSTAKATVNLDMELVLRHKINAAHGRENDRRELGGEPRLSRSTYLNAIFRDYLDAAARATAA